MSNHRPPNDPGPSVASIVGTGAVTLAVICLNFFIIWGPLDTRDILGAALGAVLAVLLMAQTVARSSQRSAAQDRIKRHEERLARAARSARPVTEPPSAALLIPREEAPSYDPGPTVLNPAGWPVPVSPGWATDQTMTWPRATEPDPESDAYPQSAEPEVAPEPARSPVEDTRRLVHPYLDHQAHGPSAAALRPIAVPVFRTEVERDAWADRHNLPTEVIPFQVYPDSEPDWTDRS